MSFILVEKLTKSLHDRVLLNDLTFAIDKGEKIALVAKNGSGKSTLIKIITGKEEFDSGNISKQTGITHSVLEQDPELNSENTIEEEIFASNSPIIRAVKLFEDSLKDPNDPEKMQEAHDAMNKFNAWEFEQKIHEILEKLKIDKLTGKISTLSGGQRKRVALAKVLIDNPDFLILDEPTNHLDLEMINWLEKFLSDKSITLLLVTHDRYFLDRTCNQILELSNGKIFKHKGNYSYYLEQKELRETNENINIDKTSAFLKKELNWVRTQPQGRQTKASARVDAYCKTKENLGQKNITEKIKLDTQEQRLGAKILEMHNVSKSFGEKKILEKFTYSFTKKEKVGIIGKNGVGKTTFLNLIMGLDNPDSGKIVTGETVKFGYYTQHQDGLNPNVKVIDSVKNIASTIKLSDGFEISASKLLERFLFTPIEQQKLIGKLSGGEKKRVSLLQILIKNPNFLILDEPTNDFDLMTLEVLENFLQNFKSNVIVISHDRYFMDMVVDHLFIFEGNGIVRDFPGNYSQYREAENNETIKLERSDDQSVKIEVEKKDGNEANELYKEIAKLEKKIKNLNTKLFNLGTDYEEIAKVSIKIDQLKVEVAAKTEQWFSMN